MLLLCCSGSSFGQLTVEQMEVYFRQGRSAWDSGFMDNGAHLDAFVSRIKQIQQDSASYQIQRIQCIATCSPDGSIPFNERLAQRRSASISRVLHKHLNFNDSVVQCNAITEDWEGLLEYVEADPQVPSREEVITLLQEMHDCASQGLSSANNCKRRLQRLDGGRPWQYMYKHFFPKLRRFTLHIYVGTRAPELLITEDDLVEIEVPDSLFDVPEEIIPYMPSTRPASASETFEEYTPRGLYVKSNAIGWAMLIGNVAVEWQFADDWSATLPVYYSALNYFTSDIKFRTLCFQPEVRYWIPALKGFFAGAHFGLAWFNYAKGGDYRYQDHFRHTPMMGGGLSAGYRKPISKNGRWHLEFSLGAGVYKLHYDIFHNEPNGKLIETKKRTFFGLDNAAVTLAYKFNLKGGGR